jgi:hypothetical protein
VNTDLEGCSEKRLWPQFEILSQHLLEGLTKTIKHLSMCSGLDSKEAPLQYNSGELPLQLTWPVIGSSLKETSQNCRCHFLIPVSGRINRIILSWISSASTGRIRHSTRAWFSLQPPSSKSLQLDPSSYHVTAHSPHQGAQTGRRDESGLARVLLGRREISAIF